LAQHYRDFSKQILPYFFDTEKSTKLARNFVRAFKKTNEELLKDKNVKELSLLLENNVQIIMNIIQLSAKDGKFKFSDVLEEAQKVLEISAKLIEHYEENSGKWTEDLSYSFLDFPIFEDISWLLKKEHPRLFN
jgi:hypothetical protein